MLNYERRESKLAANQTCPTRNGAIPYCQGLQHQYHFHSEQKKKKKVIYRVFSHTHHQPMQVISLAVGIACVLGAAYLHLATYTHAQSWTSQTEKPGYKLSLQLSSLNYPSKVKARIYSDPNIPNLAITTASCRDTALAHLPARFLQSQIKKGIFLLHVQYGAPAHTPPPWGLYVNNALTGT